MKNIKIGIILTLAVTGLALLPSTPAKAQHQLRPLPAVVVFGCEEYWENNYPKGYQVYIVSRSPNAPEIKPGSEMATVMESLIVQGFDVQQGVGFTFIATRK